MKDCRHLILLLFFTKVCDVAKETQAASSNKTKHPEGEKQHKSIFSQALNLTQADRLHLKEVFGNMTAEKKAACTTKTVHTRGAGSMERQDR